MLTTVSLLSTTASVALATLTALSPDPSELGTPPDVEAQIAEARAVACEEAADTVFIVYFQIKRGDEWSEVEEANSASIVQTHVVALYRDEPSTLMLSPLVVANDMYLGCMGSEED